MSDGVAALLRPPERGSEGPTLNGSLSSQVEREVLETLRGLGEHHPSLQELRRKLLPFYTELQIQDAIILLLQRGLILLVESDDHGSVFKLAPTESFHGERST